MSSEWMLTQEQWETLMQRVSAIEENNTRVNQQLTNMNKSLNDKYEKRAAALCLFNFLFAVSLYVLSKFGFEDSTFNPATAIFAFATNVGITALMARWMSKGKLTFEQYIHLARSAVILTGTMYATEYVGPDGGFVAMASLFFIFYTWSLIGARAGRKYLAKKRQEMVANADIVASVDVPFGDDGDSFADNKG